MKYLNAQLIVTATIFTAALTLTSCKNPTAAYADFLGTATAIVKTLPSEGESEPAPAAEAVAAPQTASKDKPTDVESGAGAAVKNKALSTITVQTADWDGVKADLNKCRAEREADKITLDGTMREQYAAGEKACLDKRGGETEAVKRAVLQESDRVIDELKVVLKRYSYPAALVNGECEGLGRDGVRYRYILKNACLNVVQKKVGNDGEITGLLGAVATEAVNQGILSLDCDIGGAHIALLPKKCDLIQGTAAGAGTVMKDSDQPRRKSIEKTAAEKNAPEDAGVSTDAKVKSSSP